MRKSAAVAAAVGRKFIVRTTMTSWRSLSWSMPSFSAAAAAGGVRAHPFFRPSTIGVVVGRGRSFSAQPESSSPPPSSSSSSSSSLSSSKTAALARDTRLAGRRRFFRNAGIAPAIYPPWDHYDPEALCDLENAQRIESADVPAATMQMADNPISAGVDGTDSATGVTLERPTREAMMSILNPRPASLSLERLLAQEKRDYDDTEKRESRRKGADADATWFSVTLDSRPLRTPLGIPLALPSASLALAIASEWDAQSRHITPAQMPLMTLACTALDQTASDPDAAIRNVLNYLRNDTTCYRTDPSEDRVLARKQSRAWDGLHDWAERVFGCRPASAVGYHEAILIGRGTRERLDAGHSPGLPHPPVLERNVTAWVRSLDSWHLTALQAATVEAKSLLVGSAVVVAAAASASASAAGANARSSLPYGSHTRDAVEACRVEEEFQIENWGLVEGGHDYDRLNCSVGVHSASVLVRCLATDAFP